jgi:hypothetical protein
MNRIFIATAVFFLSLALFAPVVFYVFTAFAGPGVGFGGRIPLFLVAWFILLGVPALLATLAWKKTAPDGSSCGTK